MRTPTGGRARTGALALILASTVALLAGCIAPPVTASGSGVVTISWASTTADVTDPDYGAAAFDAATGYGDVLELCAGSASDCGADSPGSTLFRYYPADGSMSATLSSATSMVTPAGSAATPPPGAYTLRAVGYGEQGTQNRGDLLHIVLGPPGTKDLTTWLQSVARPSKDSQCPRGHDPSWAQWPNDGAGGYVCDRTIYAYYPDEPVRGPGWDSAAPEWQWSVERAGADAPCPEGFDPSWAQWPRDGAGGHVCVMLAD